MTTRKTFLSSTTRDLVDVRRFFRDTFKDKCKGTEVTLICYEDEQSRFPGVDVQSACVQLVSECEAILLLLDRYYGSRYQNDPAISITHAELRASQDRRARLIPIIRKQTWHEFLVWKKNRALPIQYDWVQEVELFQLIEEVSSTNCHIWDEFTSGKKVAEVIDAVQILLTQNASVIMGHTTLARTQKQTESVKFEDLHFDTGQILSAADLNVIRENTAQLADLCKVSIPLVNPFEDGKILDAIQLNSLKESIAQLASFQGQPWSLAPFKNGQVLKAEELNELTEQLRGLGLK